MKRYDDEDDFNKKSLKKPKHSTNRKGVGMRILNTWSEESYDELFLEDEVDSTDELEYNQYIDPSNRKGK